MPIRVTLPNPHKNRGSLLPIGKSEVYVKERHWQRRYVNLLMECFFHLKDKFKECRSMSGDMDGIFLNVKLFLVSLYQLFEVGKSLQQTENRTVAFSLPYPI